MQVEVKEKAGLLRTLTVTVSSQKLSELKQKVVDGLSKRADLPGFRKGKAPKDVLEKKHPSL
jgi:trigger factor